MFITQLFEKDEDKESNVKLDGGDGGVPGDIREP